MKTVIDHIQLAAPTDVLNMPSLGRISQGMAILVDNPKARYVQVSSKDPGVGGFAVIPYEAIKLIRYIHVKEENV